VVGGGTTTGARPVGKRNVPGRIGCSTSRNFPWAGGRCCLARWLLAAGAGAGRDQRTAGAHSVRFALDNRPGEPSRERGRGSRQALGLGSCWLGPCEGRQLGRKTRGQARPGRGHRGWVVAGGLAKTPTEWRAWGRQHPRSHPSSTDVRRDLSPVPHRPKRKRTSQWFLRCAALCTLRCSYCENARPLIARPNEASQNRWDGRMAQSSQSYA
jgi:hypothetical protein